MTIMARSGERSALTPSATPRNAARSTPGRAIGDDAQRVDVKPGVGLIENAEARLEDGHLHDLGPLLFTAGEADVDRPAQHFLRYLKLSGTILDKTHEVRRRQFLLAPRLALGVERH